MRKTSRITSLVLGGLVLIAIACVGLFLFFGGAGRPYVPDPVYSADKSRVVIPTININEDDQDAYLQIHLEIQDTTSGETLFQVQTGASDRMRWSLAWIDENTVMLDSSDIGLYCWTDADGTWKETSCP
jgi:hypothetical protein